MNIPEELRYSTDHEWVRVNENRATVGITDYAQDALGDVVFVEAPSIGTEVEAGASFGEIESTKSVSDAFAPVSGTVTEVNGLLSEQPELLNADPYGQGWIVEIEMTDLAQLDELMDAADYAALVGD